jgi:hypothetical protein
MRLPDWALCQPDLAQRISANLQDGKIRRNLKDGTTMEMRGIEGWLAMQPALDDALNHFIGVALKQQVEHKKLIAQQCAKEHVEELSLNLYYTWANSAIQYGTYLQKEGFIAESKVEAFQAEVEKMLAQRAKWSELLFQGGWARYGYPRGLNDKALLARHVDFTREFERRLDYKRATLMSRSKSTSAPAGTADMSEEYEKEEYERAERMFKEGIDPGEYEEYAKKTPFLNETFDARQERLAKEAEDVSKQDDIEIEIAESDDEALAEAVAVDESVSAASNAPQASRGLKRQLSAEDHLESREGIKLRRKLERMSTDHAKHTIDKIISEAKTTKECYWHFAAKDSIPVHQWDQYIVNVTHSMTEVQLFTAQLGITHAHSSGLIDDEEMQMYNDLVASSTAH